MTPDRRFLPLEPFSWDAGVESALREQIVAVRASGEDPVSLFERRVAGLFGRPHALAVSSAAAGLALVLKGFGFEPGSEVIVSPFSWFQIARVVPWTGMVPVFSDIDPWTFTLDPKKAEARITEKTRAILAGSTLGHPADWDAFRRLAEERGLVLIEDASESFFSEYKGRTAGMFGEVALLQFGAPHPNCGESLGFVLTDRRDVHEALRAFRKRRRDDRFSSVATLFPSLDCAVGPMEALVGYMSLQKMPEEIKKRSVVLGEYLRQMRSFEGVKDLYRSPEANWVNSFLYMVHLGTRFGKSSRDAIIHDLRQEGIDATPYCQPLHLERFFFESGHRKGEAPVAEKLAERAIALPFYSAMSEKDVERIVNVCKDASLNVGAGSSIY